MPVYKRITVNGQREEIATGQSIDPAKWNASAGGEPSFF
ncbi:Arm DNA-binding domain-containing protein [Mucilaginibacter sp.]